MKITLIEKNEVASGTKSFIFQSEKEVKFIPGQYIYITLPKLNYPDKRGKTRHFTVSSSPTEGKIMITTRVRQESGYKKTLDEIDMGTIVEADGPMGSFTLHDNDKGPHVFLAGGIGITPYRSMTKYVIDKKLDTKLLLIYSNSHTEEIAFKNEFETWDKENENFTSYLTVTKPEESKIPWSGPSGRVDIQTISNLTKELVDPTYWISGPPAMVDAMEDLLKELKISGNKIRTDKFTGY